MTNTQITALFARALELENAASSAAFYRLFGRMEVELEGGNRAAAEVYFEHLGAVITHVENNHRGGNSRHTTTDKEA